jgi:GT2 family glycosyltransferase/glycosyltransferase involved in cell wall biosynthesis
MHGGNGGIDRNGRGSVAGKRSGIAVQAHVEGVREFRAFGWARGAEAGAESVMLICGGEPIAAPAWRVQRTDVDAALGLTGMLLGFEVDLPPTLWRARTADGTVSLRIAIDGAPLADAFTLAPRDIAALIDVAAATPDADRRRTLVQRALLHLQAVGTPIALDARQRATLAEVAGPRPDPSAHASPLPPPFFAELESHDTLLLAGWALGAQPGRECFELLCGDALVPAPLQRTQRRDVAETIGTTHLHAGFEVEIPGSVWHHAAGAARVQLRLFIDGFPVGGPLVLDRALLGGRLRTAQALPSDTARRRHTLLVLEHIADAGRLGELAPDDVALARRVARDEGVPELVGEPGAAPPWASASPPSASAWTPWLERRRGASVALGLLRGLRRLGRRWPAMQRRAVALELWLLSRTGLFHKSLYLQQLADGKASASAVRHYVTHGAADGLLPNALLDPRRYAGQLPGRRPPDIDPLLHYALEGRFHGLSPSAWFDTRFYLDANEDVRRSGMNPLRHFMSWGWRDGRAPYRGFSLANAAHQRVEIRVARRGLPATDSLLGYLLAGLPPGRALPRRQTLPWWPVAALDGIDYAASALWAGLVPRPAAPGPVIDVLVPVYAGIQETLSCLLSVLATRNEAAFELVVIDDTSPEPALSARLRELAARGLLTLLANPGNLGFVRTVNRGLALHPGRDVVILNADTVVYDGWLDRLIAHGRSADGRVASVTPMSNNATLCSYPLASDENWAPLEIGHEELDRLAARVNAGRSTPAPTGVGFCMLMRRRALEVVGLLDEEHFGRGYGEENDWCQRSERAGFANLLAADVYVRHRGAVSFGGEADERMQSVLDTLEGLHPGYLARISRFAADDGLAAARLRLDVARLVRADPRPRVISVSHARGGGTERAEAERTRRWQAEGVDVVGLRPGRRPGTVTLLPTTGLLLPNLRDIPLVDAASLAGLLASLNIVAAQIHHLVDFPAGFKAMLTDALAHLGIASEVTVHDYYAACPRINLVDESGRWCGELGPAQCARCIAAGDLTEPADSIEAWRAANLAVLAAARAIEVPDADVARRLQRYFPRLALTVVPHEDAIAVRRPGPARTQFDGAAPARVLAIGALSAIKGYAVLRELAAWAGTHAAPLHLELLGYSMDDDLLEAAGVTVHGRYDDRALAARIDALAPDLILVPSVWPETYCYVLSAALESGRRTAVFDLGAQGRRLREHGGGLLLPLALAGDPAGLAAAILAFLAEDPT